MFFVSDVFWMFRVCVVLFLLFFSSFFLNFFSVKLFRNNFIFLVAKFFSKVFGWRIMCIGELS